MGALSNGEWEAERDAPPNAAEGVSSDGAGAALPGTAGGQLPGGAAGRADTDDGGSAIRSGGKLHSGGSAVSSGGGSGEDSLPVIERVRRRVAALDGIEGQPLADHAAQYDEVHVELQSALTEIDGQAGGGSGSGSGPGGQAGGEGASEPAEQASSQSAGRTSRESSLQSGG